MLEDFLIILIHLRLRNKVNFAETDLNKNYSIVFIIDKAL